VSTTSASCGPLSRTLFGAGAAVSVKGYDSSSIYVLTGQGVTRHRRDFPDWPPRPRTLGSDKPLVRGAVPTW